MKQSGVFRAIYEVLLAALAAEGERTGLFRVEGFSAREEKGGAVRLFVSDMCQTSQDRGGERVIAGEFSYEAPSRFCVALGVLVSGRDYPCVLECAGAVARFFKDSRVFSAEGCGWHGNGKGVFILEPEIREPAALASEAVEAAQGERLSLVLRYRVEAAINSEKGGSFRRVEKRDIKARSIIEGG
ncbi:MAG: hypothetical protein LBC67_06195 [Spirochaetales bacterium]|jgi:hypothetical protein|nr:hypothetical protein [Spirochaetales bacterium]